MLLSAFKNNEQTSTCYTCDGENIYHRSKLAMPKAREELLSRRSSDEIINDRS